MKPGYITFGEHSGKTLEEICFKDFLFVDWILREAEANRWEVNRWVIGHLEHLFDVARAKSVKGLCQVCSRRKPTIFSIAYQEGNPYGRSKDRANPMGAWRICEDCIRNVSQPRLFFCPISFSGFRRFVREFRAKGDAAKFALALAHAWGIVRPGEKLTKKRIFTFFGVEK